MPDVNQPHKSSFHTIEQEQWVWIYEYIFRFPLHRPTQSVVDTVYGQGLARWIIPWCLVNMLFTEAYRCCYATARLPEDHLFHSPNGSHVFYDVSLSNCPINTIDFVMHVVWTLHNYPIDLPSVFTSRKREHLYKWVANKTCICPVVLGHSVTFDLRPALDSTYSTKDLQRTPPKISTTHTCSLMTYIWNESISGWFIKSNTLSNTFAEWQPQTLTG